MTHSSLEIANLVGSGDLDVEIYLSEVVEEGEFLNHERISDVEHSRSKGNRLLIDFVHSHALGILAPSGVYVITGAKSFDELYTARDDIILVLHDLGIIDSPDDDGEFSVQNMVCTVDFEEPLDLNEVTVVLGLEATEYEPEQFPGLVYRPDSTSTTILLFGTGKSVITGARSLDECEAAYELIKRELSSILTTDL